MNKLIPEGTVLPAGTRIGKCFNTANWNCHGAGKAGAGMCYKKPFEAFRLLLGVGEGELWHA